MLAEHPLVTSLETKIDDLCRDRAIASRIVDGLTKTAIEEYLELREDPAIPVGIRYLALSCLADRYALYEKERDISILKDIIGREINTIAHTEVINAVRVIKDRYDRIYECNRHAFDRFEIITGVSLNPIAESERFQNE